MKTWDDVKMVNCAGCNDELLGESMRPAALKKLTGAPTELPRQVKGRILERPYCSLCLSPDRFNSTRTEAGKDRRVKEDNPSQQDSLKRWEEES